MGYSSTNSQAAGPPVPGTMPMFSTQQIGNFGVMTQATGAVTSAVGSYFSAQAQKNALSFQAETAAANAKLAETNAQGVLKQGDAAAHSVQLRGAQLEGTQRATIAANGLDLGEGSPARILATTKAFTSLDAQQTEANAVRAAWGYRTQATGLNNSALLDNAASENISPFESATTSLLGGAGSVASSWYRLQKSGG